MRHILTLTLLTTVLGCNKSGAESTPPEAATSVEPASVTATEPDREKLVTHTRAHLELPADRAKILEACADTPEFSEGEKQWISEHLPEGDYTTPEDVLAALGIPAE
jgi:hypothetical protein